MSKLADQMNAEKAKVLALEVRLAKAEAELARLRPVVDKVTALVHAVDSAPALRLTGDTLWLMAQDLRATLGDAS